MKKLLLLFLAFCAISCDDTEFAPIEKWGGSKYVIVDKQTYDDKTDWLRLKNPDKIGDTIK